MVEILEGDCLEVMLGLPDNSIDLIATDPPYFKVKTDAWDRQWEKSTAFLGWLDTVLSEFHRILKPNGSLYLFASPQMAARVEVLMAERFNVLNRITWAKPPYSTKAEMFRKSDLRAFFPVTEIVLFAEHYGADNIAKGEAGYEAKCDQLRGFVFEPLRAYLRGEWTRVGLTRADMNMAVGSSRSGGGMASHYIGDTGQWELPTATHYLSIQNYANSKGRRPAPPYEDFHESPRSRFERTPHIDLEYLRADYEDLKADYEDLRRPFKVSSDVPYTDVWDFATVKPYPDKHPCEKPISLMRHIIKASGKQGGTVLDPFAGSGTTGEAAQMEGMDAILIERDARYVSTIKQRLSQLSIAI